MAGELFKKLVDIGGSGLAKAYERLSGLAPNVSQTEYYSGTIDSVAQVLPPPTAWDTFRLTNDIIRRNVNGAGFIPILLPPGAPSESIDFNFSDLIANGEFHEYRIGPPPDGEIWRIHGVNFTFNSNARLQIQSFETVDILNLGVVGITQSRYFGQNSTGIFYPGPPATIVNVKAEPKPWDMIPRQLPAFAGFPQLLINVRNDNAVGTLNFTFHIAITRMVRATAPEPPR